MRDILGPLLARAERHLPLGGAGPFTRGPDHVRRFQRRAKTLYWRKNRWRALRLPLAALAYAMWVATNLSRYLSSRMSPDVERIPAGVAWDVIVGSKSFDEAVLHRRAFPKTGHIVIPQRSASVALRSLGSTASKALLGDKLAMSRALRERAIPTPPILSEITSPDQFEAFLRADSIPADLFAKVRHGSGGKAAFRVQAGTPFSDTAIAARRALLRDSLLMQPFVHAAGELASISDAPPVLRLTTFRPPSGGPRVLDAYLSVFAPGQNARDWRLGAVRYPVHPESGVLLPGLWLASPSPRFPEVPWNGMRLAGLMVPHFRDACDGVLRAAEIVPDMPLLGWDVIPGKTGAMVLEGNWGLHWVLSHLWHTESGLTPESAYALLDWA